MNVKFKSAARTCVHDVYPGQTFRVRDTVYLRIAIDPSKFKLPVDAPMTVVIDIITGEMVSMHIDSPVELIAGHFVEE